MKASDKYPFLEKQPQRPAFLKQLTPVFFLILFLALGCQNSTQPAQSDQSPTAEMPDTTSTVTIQEGGLSQRIMPSEEKQYTPSSEKVAEKSSQSNLPKENVAAIKSSNPGVKTPETVEEFEKNNPSKGGEESELINELKQLSSVERTDMLAEKKMAEQAGSKNLAKSLFDKGVENEQAGDQQFLLATRTSLFEAQKLYRVAKESYKSAKDLANSSKNTAIKTEAENARTALTNTKQSLSGKQAELKGLPKYENALEFESIGERHFQQQNYEAARNAFQQAKNLFVEAANEAKTAPPPVKTTPPVAKEEVNPAEDNSLTQRKIKIMLDEYANGMETNDLSSLRSKGFITSKEQAGWDQFFKNVKDLTVKIDNEKFDINQNQAQVNFQVKMSYFNKSKGKREDNQFPKQWKLEATNGNWKIVSLN